MSCAHDTPACVPLSVLDNWRIALQRFVRWLVMGWNSGSDLYMFIIPSSGVSVMNGDIWLFSNNSLIFDVIPARTPVPVRLLFETYIRSSYTGTSRTVRRVDASAMIDAAAKFNAQPRSHYNSIVVNEYIVSEWMTAVRFLGDAHACVSKRGALPSNIGLQSFLHIGAVVWTVAMDRAAALAGEVVPQWTLDRNTSYWAYVVMYYNGRVVSDDVGDFAVCGRPQPLERLLATPLCMNFSAPEAEKVLSCMQESGCYFMCGIDAFVPQTDVEEHYDAQIDCSHLCDEDFVLLAA